MDGKQAMSDPITHTFLQQQPKLLYDLITQDKHDAVLAILSHPLPPDVALPEQCQSFFLDILDHTASSPTEQAVKRLHTLMNGALRPLTTLLTHQTLEKIERRLLSIVNSTQSADGNCFALYALSTMTCMLGAISPAKTISSFNADDLITGTPHWVPTKLNDYFTGRKAPKTLQLVVLKALWACRSENSEAREALHLSNELVKHISPSIREGWCKTNVAILRKLEEKVVQPGVADQLRIVAMLFLSNLQSPFMAPQVVQSTWSTQLGEPLKLAELLLPLSDNDLQLFFMTVAPSALTGFVQFVPDVILRDQLTQQSTTALIRALDVIVKLIDTQLLLPDTIPTMAHQSTAAQYSQLLTLVRQTGVTLREDGACSVHFVAQRNIMIARLCSLQLKAAICRTRSSQHHTALDVILELHAATHQSTKPCSHALPTPERSVYKPISVTSNVHDWQDALDDYLQGRLIAERDSIRNLFHDRWQDLERRCAEVEQPLREERARYHSLQDRYEEVSASNVNILEKAAQLEQLVQQERDRHTFVATELQSMLVENDSLSSKLAESAQHIEQAASQHALKVQDLERQHSADMLEYSIELATKQSQVDDLLEKLSHQQKEHEECQYASDRLMKTVENLTIELQEQNQKAARTHEEYTLTLNNLTNARNESRAEVQQQIKRHTESLSMLKSQAHDELTAALQTISADHERALSRQQHQHVERLQALQDQLTEAQEKRTEVEDEVVQAHATIHEYTIKIEKLESMCITKDEEIARLSTVHDNMLAAMGIRPAQQGLERDDDSTTSTADPKPGKASALPEARSHKHTHRKSASVSTVVPQPTSVLRRATSDVLPSNASSRRRPLTAMSANVSPSRRHTSKGHVSKIWEEDLNETVFNGDDLLMSTPQMEDMI
ncbi:hypothetical protein AMS68_004797 [Peltaster fructicola]|uniref:Uncharacterized protein n=1 Tax=Peltaster fructicola TaxID=286661 RepID=A0A6H0XXY4_9PEZI|nr:hypothetical protein AMS68_004797 [Peltaster fructicola]